MENEISSIEEWKKSETEVFWGEIAPCDHLVQIYESDNVILESLEGFVTSGLNNNESVIIIATTDHIKALNRRLILNGLDINDLQLNNQYVPLNAEETLEKFMVDGWPDDKRFMNTVKSIVNKARGKENRR